MEITICEFLRFCRTFDGSEAKADVVVVVTVQVVKTGITPQLATSDRSREAETEPLPPAGRLHMRR